MKKRNRKKAYRCAHYHESSEFIESTPYNYYHFINYCGLGKYCLDSSNSSSIDDPKWKGIHPCETCKKFKLCKRTVRQYRKDLDILKNNDKHYRYLYKKFSYLPDDALNEIALKINYVSIKKLSDIDDIVYNYKNKNNE